MLRRLEIMSKGPCLAAVLVAAIAGCTSSSRTNETTGQYVDDSTITAKVKTAFVQDSGLHATDISVGTYKYVVQLSGFVDTSEEKARAGEVAAAVPGVKSVKNDIHVK